MASSHLTQKTVAVVGSGVSGLVCASRLAEHGFGVTVFDIGRGPGGRMSQRRERTADGESYYFDHGAQYFTIKDKTMQILVDKWESAGLVAEWEGKFGSYDVNLKTFIEDSDRSKKRYVGVPGMNAICQALSQQQGIQTRFGVTVTNLNWEEDHKNWVLVDKSGERLGEFQAIVATDKNMASPRFSVQHKVPPPLAGAGVPNLMEKLAGVTSSSSISIMLAFSERLTSIPFDGFTIAGSKVLAWASRDSSKPGRGEHVVGYYNYGSLFRQTESQHAIFSKDNYHLFDRECWVLQSTPEYAQEIVDKHGLDKPSNDLLTSIAYSCFDHFKEIGNIPYPIFAKAHRWGSAFPKSCIAVEDKCLVDDSRCIAVCGDFCLGPKVECAILSGLAAAKKIQACLAARTKL